MAADTDNGALTVPRKRGITFDSTINLGHILTMLVLVGSVMQVYFSLDKRISKQEDLAPFVQSARDATDLRVQNSLTTLSVDLKDVKSSVDKLSLAVQVQSAITNTNMKGNK